MSSIDRTGPDPDGTFQELARAKVNLTLRVVGKRPDGYHELQSLVVFADVGDVLSLRPEQHRVVTVEGPFAAGIVGENLVARALDLLTTLEPALRLGSVTLQKNIPVAAGLGGGSADAAALLRAVRRANPDVERQVDWHSLAARLGADVPVCLDQTSALMWGIGDRLRPIASLPRLDVVLVRPAIAAPHDKTGQVFRRLGAGPVEAMSGQLDAVPPFASTEDLIEYVAAHGNDLETPARLVMPDTAEAENALAACSGCAVARMSGAGPSWFGLFRSRDQARAAAEQISRKYPDWWVQAVTLG